MPILFFLTPSLCRKIGLSLSYLVLEIIRPKFGLIFHQDLSLTFCTNFHVDFQNSWPHFLLFLDHFDPALFQNLKSDCVHFFIMLWTTPPSTNFFFKVPPMGPGPWKYNVHLLIVVYLHADVLIVVHLHADLLIVIHLHGDLLIVVYLHADLLIVVHLHADLYVDLLSSQKYAWIHICEYNYLLYE